jgi:hypothetical protein
MVGGVLLFAGASCVFSTSIVTAQALTGALIGTVKDAQGGVLRGALVRLTSPALIGGQETLTTDETGQMRFPILPPGDYVLDIELQGFASYHEAEIRIGAGATRERTAVLQLAGVAESIVVQGAGSRIEARDPGFGTRFGPEDVRSIPTRRNSMFDFIKAAPGISPTAPSSGKNNTISAFGSSTNENHFLFDGTLHLPVQRRRASGAGNRFHSGSAGPIRWGVSRVRQRSGRRDQRRHPSRKRAFSV